ncbi:MAG: glycoside hydrolase family 172 protein [Janthinobacterium lividum]
MIPTRTFLYLLAGLWLLAAPAALAQSGKFNGLSTDLGNLYRLSDAKSRSISPENPTGGKGQGSRATEGTGKNAARDLGPGWKISPSIIVKPGETAVLADMTGPGAVQRLWMTPTGHWRFEILRVYWDDEPTPSIEVPVGDFFGQGWEEMSYLTSLPILASPGMAFTSYWQMPFRKRCRMTLTNIDESPMTIYYQVDYVLTDVPADAAYFHAQFRRQNPMTAGVPYVIVDGIMGRGQYVGTFLAWSPHSNDWWGEGEVKFYLDGDGQYPTINNTGLEDYFLGSYNFENKKTREYIPFCTPYGGLNQVIKGNGLYNVQQRFGLYRWHVPDPIRFDKDLRVTVQGLGWRYNGRYLLTRDDVASVAYWYQTEPHAPFPKLPSKDELEVSHYGMYD